MCLASQAMVRGDTNHGSTVTVPMPKDNSPWLLFLSVPGCDEGEVIPMPRVKEISGCKDTGDGVVNKNEPFKSNDLKGSFFY
jgi:hypothetical protein